MSKQKSWGMNNIISRFKWPICLVGLLTLYQVLTKDEQNLPIWSQSTPKTVCANLTHDFLPQHQLPFNEPKGPINFMHNPRAFIQAIQSCETDSRCRLMYHHVGKTGGTTIESKFNKLWNGRRYEYSCCGVSIVQKVLANTKRNVHPNSHPTKSMPLSFLILWMFVWRINTYLLLMHRPEWSSLPPFANPSKDWRRIFTNFATKIAAPEVRRTSRLAGFVGTKIIPTFGIAW